MTVLINVAAAVRTDYAGNAGKGGLVKCYVERITHDYTAGDLTCPQCGTQFAREAVVHGRPAHKIVGGKVYMK
jgi:hypothetical protein